MVRRSPCNLIQLHNLRMYCVVTRPSFIFARVLFTRLGATEDETNGTVSLEENVFNEHFLIEP